jgi:hypothetical protein
LLEASDVTIHATPFGVTRNERGSTIAARQRRLTRAEIELRQFQRIAVTAEALLSEERLDVGGEVDG